MDSANVAMSRTSRTDTTPMPRWGEWDSSDGNVPEYVTNYSRAVRHENTNAAGFRRSALPYFSDRTVNSSRHDPSTSSGHGRIETEDGSFIDVTYEGFGGFIDRLSSGPAADVDEDIKKKAISKVVPATVQIRVAGNDGQSWAGSGFILDPEDAEKLLPGGSFPAGTYFISTNHHVANDAKKITIITADGRKTFRAEVVKNRDGSPLLDGVADTALLMITSDEELPTAKIGNPADLSQGDTVLTAGYPMALPKVSVTKGIVSQPAQITGDAVIAIQTDAAINPGNSGGPLFTLDGRVIGTNTYTILDTNDMSFVLPITEQFAVLGKIWKEGEVVRGDLGIDVREFKESKRNVAGFPEGVPAALISDVRPGSRAAELGLKRGDIISKIEVLRGDRIEKIIETDIMYQFQRTFVMKQIHRLEPGRNVRVKVYRLREDGTYEEKILGLSVSKYEPPQELYSSEWGIKVDRDNRGGLLLTEVFPGSPAERAKIEGDGKWVIRGLWAREFGTPEPLVVKSIPELQEIFEGLRRTRAAEILLYLEDAADPRKRRTVALKREFSEELLLSSVDDNIIDGALLMAA